MNPQNDSYTADAGTTDIYVGRFAPGGTPAWLAAMSEGHWGTIAGGTGEKLQDVITEATVVGAEGNPAITSAWNGATYLPDLKRYFVGPSGGHNARYENDCFALDIGDDAPTWFEYRASGPVTGGVEGHNTDADYSNDEPRSPHTYNHIVGAGNYFWMTGVDAMASLTGWTSAIHYRLLANKARGDKTAVFERMTNPLPTTGMSGTQNWLGGGAAYDPTSGYIFACDQYGFDTPANEKRFVRTDPSTGAQLLFNSPASETGYNWVAVAEELRLLIVGGFAGGSLHRIWYANIDTEIDAGTATITWHGATLSGSPNITGQGIQAHYHHPSRALFAWHGNGANIRKCAIPVTLTDAWALSTVSPSVGNAVTPSAAQGNGTFGRFQLARNLGGVDAFVLLNDIDEATYVFRIPAAGL